MKDTFIWRDIKYIIDNNEDGYPVILREDGKDVYSQKLVLREWLKEYCPDYQDLDKQKLMQ